MRSKGSNLILAIFVVALIATASVYLIKTKGIFKPTPSPTPIANIIKADENTDDWITYKHKGFEIKYPSDWNISETYQDMIGNVPYISNLRNDGERIEGYLGTGGSFGSTALLEPIDIKIGNQNWELRKDDIGGYENSKKQKFNTSVYLYTLGKVGNPTFALSLTVPRGFPTDLPIVTQILTTLKFTH